MLYLQVISTIVLSLGMVPTTFAASAINLAAGASENSAAAASTTDSLVALIIIVSSVLTAWSLNFKAPKVRVFGTLLAASGCLALAAWFFLFVINTGFLENPRPNQTPMDSAKPALLWMQGSIALVTGLFLLLVAFRQSKSTETLILSAANEEDRFGRVSRILHWTTAFLFISLIPMGIFASIIPDDMPYRLGYYVVHKTIGVVVLALLIFRLIWNRKSERPSLDASLTSAERKLASGVHFTLYLMMFAVPVTGFIMTSYHGYATFFFGWELQPLWAPSDTATIFWGLLHKYLLPYLLYMILGAHVLGALKHQFIDKHQAAFKRMVN